MQGRSKWNLMVEQDICLHIKTYMVCNLLHGRYKGYEMDWCCVGFDCYEDSTLVSRGIVPRD